MKSHRKTLLPVTLSLIIIFSWLTLWACVHTQTVEPVCRHHALYAAVSWGDLRDEPVKVALGPTSRKIPGSDEVFWHAQAQARVDGKWEWLEVGYDNTVYVGDRDNFQPTKYMSALEFSMWLIRGNPNLFKGGLK